jgi:hypothetical protein
MKANAWRKFLEEQRVLHGKVLYTVTELANVAGACGAALNVELTRLRDQEVIEKYAHGLYGLPRAVTPQDLVAAIDSHAYITGHYALYVHGLVTQKPVVITCFTDRQSPRARERATPLGRLDFACVRSDVYSPTPTGTIAPPAQALCDYVYLSRRPGTSPESLVTFRNLARIRDADFLRILARYPRSVQEYVAPLA